MNLCTRVLYTRVLTVAVLLVATACAKRGPVVSPPLPKPALAYCEKQGGRVGLSDAPEGQSGICVLPHVSAMTAKSGHYSHTLEDGSTWRYEYDIHAAGTRSERRIGWLWAEGLHATIAAANPGDTIQTPWGVMARMPDTPYEHGFLLERTQGRPIDPSQGSALKVPPSMLARGGRWDARVGPWRYTVLGLAVGSKSERRIGRLRFGGVEVSGEEDGDHVDTPWGPLRWLGPIDLEAITDYEQGFLLRGVRDRGLDHLEGDAVLPVMPEVTSVVLESLYLSTSVELTKDALPAHSVRLLLSGESSDEVKGTLALDPNVCTLDVFGDRQACTRTAIRALEVEVRRLSISDPTGAMRRYFVLSGEGVPAGLALVVQGELEDGGLQRGYLVLRSELVPLYLGEGG